eukprot:maker-scaffold161_size295871-snap-gene-0.9 protein:Tk05097 transcript:maker-scaffold161_size295871-snap-gene-0.9-mRNA-1 annotation:"hypothetical protein HELRODRAFT_113249"
MTQFLPPNLLALFAPREPIPYLPPPDKLPSQKKNVHNYLGVAQFIAGNFEDPKDTPPPVKAETRDERLARKKREKEEQVAYKLEQEIALWDPSSVPEITTDPFKTLFVGRINYYSSESKIRREFESYGSIKKIQVCTDPKSEKPRGYCFIEFEHERDMHSAYKKADGMKIDGRRVLVDVERARTVKGWLPRRLGGGLGGTRRGGADVNVRHSGREDGPRHRSRSRERERDTRRSRSKDRKRRRSRSRSRKRTRRSRSRGEKRRSRSRDRKRTRRTRSKSRGGSERKDRRDRDRRRDPGLNIKDEPEGYDEFGVQVKQEQEDRKPDFGYQQGYEENY